MADEQPKKSKNYYPEATAKYRKKAYDIITFRVYKGKKQEFKNHAASRDESFNGFINRALNETVERDNSNLK